MNKQLKFNSDFIYKHEYTINNFDFSHIMLSRIVFVILNKNVLTSEHILL